MNQVQNGKFWGAQAASLPCSAACRAFFVDAPSLKFATLECEEQPALRCRLAACAPQSSGIGRKTNTSALIRPYFIRADRARDSARAHSHRPRRENRDRGRLCFG